MKLKENLTTEFKREYVEDIKKTVIAFANTNGGKIYIGVQDDGSVVGVRDTDETMLKATNAVRNSIKPDVTMFVDCSTEETDGKNIVILEIQKGTSSPYYLAGKGIRPEGVFVRQGSSTVPATEAAILKMIKETDGNEYEDLRSLNQELTFVAAKKEFRTSKVEFGKPQMKTLGLVSEDGMYSNLALLLSDQCVHTIKLAVFEGTEKEVFKDRHEFTGSVLAQLNEAFSVIDRYNRTRAEFDGLRRIDMQDYPLEAIRETLLNSLVHRDYAFSGSTLVSIFDDRIEFVSLGGLIKGITFDDIMLGASILRNRKLANVFYRLKLIEAYGTGMPKIMNSYKNREVKPQIQITDNAFKITLPNTNRTELKIMEEAATYTESEQEVIKLFKNKDIITRKDVENELKISQALAVRIIKKLIDKSTVKKLGDGKNTRYELGKQL
ncbi:MAG: RNA-binding domain-containing protein [Clostridia bacterium]|jgi:ATP-dependent DNA helicase RecG